VAASAEARHAPSVHTDPAKVSQELKDSVNFPLYNFADLQTVRTWNYEKPTLVRKDRFTFRNSWQEASTFWNKIKQSYPIFQRVDLDGLAIFGGAIVDMLLDISPKDIDLTYFNDQGTPEDQGQALAQRVDKFVTDIYRFTEEYNAELKRKQDEGIPIDGSTRVSKYTPININDLLVTRYKNTYQIKMPDQLCAVPIQITHCTDLSKLLSEIDISCTAIAYYEGEIVMPARAKQALEDLAFEINSCDKSVRYLERVTRYFDKGFDVILPDLCVAKLHMRNLGFGLTEVLDMPYFRVFYSGIRGNKIQVERCELTDSTTSEVCSGVDGYWSRKDASEMSVGELIHKNIRHLVHGNFGEFTYIGQGETYRQAFMSDILITERMLINSYETISKTLFNDKALNICKIEQYFTCRKITDILRELIIEFAQESKGKEIYTSQAFDDHVEAYLEQLVVDQISEAKNSIVKLKGTGSLAIESNRVDSIACDKKHWYGAYFNFE